MQQSWKRVRPPAKELEWSASQIKSAAGPGAVSEKSAPAKKLGNSNLKFPAKWSAPPLSAHSRLELGLVHGRLGLDTVRTEGAVATIESMFSSGMKVKGSGRRSLFSGTVEGCSNARSTRRSRRVASCAGGRRWQ